MNKSPSFSALWMSLKCSTCLAIAALAANPLQAATSSVVGFYDVQVPSGNSAWVCGLVTADLYQGSAATVTADVDGKALVTFTSPAWTPSAFSLHYVEPQSGIGQGLAIDILSNTADTLKLNTTAAAAGLTSGMTFIIRKHNTLGGMLPTGGGFFPLEDSLTLFNSSGQQTNYFWNGTSWQTILATPSNSVIVRPGQGFLIYASDPISLTLGRGDVCYVKTTPTKVRVNVSVPNFVGALNPLGSNTTLSALGVLPSMEPFEDSLVLFTSGSFLQSGTYLTDGSNFFTGINPNASSTTLPTGASVLVNVLETKNVTFSPVVPSP